MDKTTLYVGAVVMFVCGLALQIEASLCVGLGLMWIGFSIEKNQP